MGVGPKSESSCQTQFTIPPYVTKQKIRDSKSYMKNLQFPRIPSGKDVNPLLSDSQPQDCLLPRSEDTLENIVMYEDKSTDETRPNQDENFPGVESPKRLSYKSFFQENKFSRNSSALLHLKEGLDPGTKDKSAFLKDNLRMASEVSNFLKYLRRKGTDFLTMFDLDNLNSLIDDISNMKHFAEPVSYEDSAATLRTESGVQQELLGENSSEGGPPVCRRSVSVGTEITRDSNTENTPPLEDSTDKMRKVSFDSVKHQSSLHSAARNSIAAVLDQEVDGACLSRGKALKCVTVTRDRHVRVYIKGKSTCTTIDLCPEYVARPKPDIESTSEELVTDVSLCEGEFNAVNPFINVSPDGGTVGENANARPSPREEPVSEKRDQKRGKKCEISAEFQVESLQQRLMFLEVCKRLNKAKMSKSENSSSSEVAKVVSESENAKILETGSEDWKKECMTTAVSELAYGDVTLKSASDSDKGDEEASVTTIDVKEQTAREENLKVATLTKERMPLRLVKSDLFFGNGFCFTGFKGDVTGQFFSEHTTKNNEAKCYVMESSGFANFHSRHENVDTLLALPDEESKLSSDLKEGSRISAEEISLQNKTSYLDVTEGRDKGGNELEDSTSLGNQNTVTKEEPKTKFHMKNIFLELLSGKKKSPKYELKVDVSPSDGKLCDAWKEAVCSESARRLLERVAKSSVELERFDFTFANFNQIFLGRNLQTPSSSDIDVAAKWTPEAHERLSSEDKVHEVKYDSTFKELDSDQSSGNRTKDSVKRHSFYRKKYMKKILFASEDSDKTEDSSNLESSQSNISSVLDPGSDSQDTKVRFMEEELVCCKIYPRPKTRCEDLSEEECNETSEDPGKELRDADDDFLTKVEAISRHMSEDLVSIRNNVSATTTTTTTEMTTSVELPTAASTSTSSPPHIATLNSAKRLSHSSKLNADLQRLKALCEDAIQRTSRDVEDVDVSASVTESEVAQEFYELPSVSVANASGSLEHSYCGGESVCEDQSPEPPTTVTTLLYPKRQNLNLAVTPQRSDNGKNKNLAPSGSAHPSKGRNIISCRATFNAEECSSANAQRVEGLVQRLCHKLSYEHPHTFNSPQSLVGHFERVGKRLYMMPIEKLKSDLKFVMGRGLKESKPQLRKEEVFRQRAKQDLKREPVDRNAKMREKIAKIKRKCSKC